MRRHLRRGTTRAGKLLVYGDGDGDGVAKLAAFPYSGAVFGVGGCDTPRYVARDSHADDCRRRGVCGGGAIRGSCVLRGDVRAGRPCAYSFYYYLPVNG